MRRILNLEGELMLGEYSIASFKIERGEVTVFNTFNQNALPYEFHCKLGVQDALLYF